MTHPDRNDRSIPERRQVVVIGAGQAGLAAGYHLARRGLEFVILEAHPRVGDVWRTRYDSLLLYSPAKYDALPGLPFPVPRNAFPTGRQMADYLETYASRMKLPVQTGVAVDHLRSAGGEGGFVLSAGARRLAADQVILATGPFQRPHLPSFAAELDPSIRQLHSADYRNPSQLADGPVLVVGVSHSGADLAYELAAGRRTILSGRSHGQLPFSVDSRRGRMAWPVLRLVATHLLNVRTPIGRKMAPRVRAGGGPLLRWRRDDLLRAGVEWHESRTVGVRDGRPMLADGQVIDVANVVWCTGFRPDYGWIEPAIAGEDGWPDQERGAVRAAPGLYVLGIPFLSSFTSMLVVGAGADARRVVDQVARRASREAEPAPERRAAA
ncbi:MAG: flavin-containing monooxygenase [Candidatus Limnocylindria bacterium]